MVSGATGGGLKSSPLYLGILVALLVLAVAGFGLYATSTGNANAGATNSSGETTVTTTVVSTITTRPPTNGSLAFSGTLVIIPDRVSVNTSLNFTPSTIRVVVGVNNTITWLNQDKESQHTVVTSSVPSGAVDFSVVIPSGQTYATTLNVPGTYSYYCMWHPDWMKGKIVVVNG